MKLYTRLLVVATTTLLASAPMAMAEMNRTQATLIGAAVGGVVGNATGNDMQSTLLGAAAGGLLGHLLSPNNHNYQREGRPNNRYYYGGREFNRQDEYLAYREAARRNMLRDHERTRYQRYRGWQRQYVQAYPPQYRDNNTWGQPKHVQKHPSHYRGKSNWAQPRGHNNRNNQQRNWR